MRLVLLPQMRYKLFGGEPNGETWRSLDRQAVEENRTAVASSTETTKRRATLDRQPVRDRRDPLGLEDGGPVVRSARGIPESLDVLAPAATMGGGRRLAENVESVLGRARRTRPPAMGERLHRRDLCSRQKRGSDIGKTKRGKGSKLMVVVDGKGVPLGISVTSASPAEVKLVAQTLKTIAVPRPGRGRPRQNPPCLIADRAYDSDPLRNELARQGIDLISPHRKNRVKAPTQDGRKLRRYKHRWIVERTIAWLGAFRHLVVRYERSTHLYLAFLHFASALLVLRRL